MGIPLKPFINPLVGRPLHFTPKQLAEKFQEYVWWCENSVIESEVKKSGSIGMNRSYETKTIK